MHSVRLGRPGVVNDGENAGLDRPLKLEVEATYGKRRLLRSDRGCPIVDISQLLKLGISYLIDKAYSTSLRSHSL